MKNPVCTIETTLREGFPDPVADGILASAREEGFTDVKRVRRATVYRFKGNLASGTPEKIARNLLADPITETFSIDTSIFENMKGSVVEVAFNPGVMDPVEASTRKALTELGIRGVHGIKTGMKFLFEG
ncbi:MAG: phosphoribosylformylglycinamidine synthase subunit PurS, partial [bacterium]